MKKLFTAFFSLIIIQASVFGQFDDRLDYLTDKEVGKFIQPFVNYVGTSLNSGMYHSASVSDVFGFTFGFQGMLIFIPEDQKTFTPALDKEGYTADKPTATIFGKEGAYYSGPEGYIVFPGGLDLNNVPMFVPQIGISTFGTELLVRFIPKISLGENELGYWGVGVKHSISRYFPLPLDVAAQVFYSKLEVTDIMTSKNLSINLLASKNFALVCLYGGIQIESSSMNLKYTFKDPSGLYGGERKIELDIDGENTFRFTVGAALELGFIVLNADYSIGNQSVINGGLSFEF